VHSTSDNHVRDRYIGLRRPTATPSDVVDRAPHGRLVLAATFTEQADTTYPVCALELYGGPTVAVLRQRLGGIPTYRRRIRLLSARHGLVHPDQCLTPYQQPLYWPAALELREHLAVDLRRDPTIDPQPDDILIIASPLWMVALAGLLHLPDRPALHWCTESETDLAPARKILDGWGWP
jgi:hypothetical protein